jgi:drug/metabolite transporter (DMT)-like permease
LLGLAFIVDGPAGLAAPVHASALVWLALAFLTAGATVLAYAWYFEGVARLGAGGASAYISLVPVFGVGSSVLLLGEELGASLWMGSALAVGGVVVMQRARQSLG